MKKSLVFILAAILVMTFTAACSSVEKNNSTVGEIKPTANKAETASKGKPLIVYYSLSGNTRTVAEQLQNLIGADVAEIKTVTPYPDDFHAVVEQAREERRTGFLPPIHSISPNIEEYDTIYLGYPVWGNTIPQPMATFLSQNTLAGKTVIPFCTHDGYGIGRSFEVIAEYCPNARLLAGFDRLGSEARTAEGPLSEWLKNIGTMANGTQNSQTENSITIAIGNAVLSGTLNDSAEANALKKILPQTVSMSHYGGREYYGRISGEISAKAQGQLHFEDGDITYCPKNNTIAIFYAQTDKPTLTMRVIPVGKVTSDLSVFHTLGRSAQMTFSLAK